MASILDLKKSFEGCLEENLFPKIPVMRTKIAIDVSGSMDNEIRNGYVDSVLYRFLAVAQTFDDDGELETYMFNDRCKQFPSIKEAPRKYCTLNDVRAIGGTSFAPVINTTLIYQDSGSWLSKLKRMAVACLELLSVGFPFSETPSYLAIITDGSNQDRSEFEKALNKASERNHFIQIIGIGDEVDTYYCRMVAGEHKNVAFHHFLHPNSVSSKDMYESICNTKFRDWIQQRNNYSK